MCEPVSPVSALFYPFQRLKTPNFVVAAARLVSNHLNYLVFQSCLPSIGSLRNRGISDPEQGRFLSNGGKAKTTAEPANAANYFSPSGFSPGECVSPPCLNQTKGRWRRSIRALPHFLQ